MSAGQPTYWDLNTVYIEQDDGSWLAQVHPLRHEDPGRVFECRARTLEEARRGLLQIWIPEIVRLPEGSPELMELMSRYAVGSDAPFPDVKDNIRRLRQE